MTLLHVLYDTYSEVCLLLHFQTNSGIFTCHLKIFNHIGPYLEPSVTLAYLEPCLIQNCSICIFQDIIRTLSRHILVYPEHCNASILRTLPFFMLRILTYLGPEAYVESYLYWHIQVYS